MSELFISILKKGEEEANNYDELLKNNYFDNESDYESERKDENNFYCYTDALINYLVDENNKTISVRKVFIYTYLFSIIGSQFISSTNRATCTMPQDGWLLISRGLIGKCGLKD